MNNTELLLRQHRLLDRSQQLRQDLVSQSRALARPLAAIDVLQRGLRWLYRHPQWSLAAVSLVVVMRPGRALRWAGRLWWAWQTWQRVRRIYPL